MGGSGGMGGELELTMLRSRENKEASAPSLKDLQISLTAISGGKERKCR